MFILPTPKPPPQPQSPAARRGARLCRPVAARQCWALSGPSSSVVLAATSTRPRLLGSAAAAHSFPKRRSYFLFLRCIVLFLLFLFFFFFFISPLFYRERLRRVLKRNLETATFSTSSAPKPISANHFCVFFSRKAWNVALCALPLSGLVRMFEFIHRAEMKNVYSLIKYIKVFCDALMSFHHGRATEKDVQWDDDARPYAQTWLRLDPECDWTINLHHTSNISKKKTKKKH